MRKFIAVAIIMGMMLFMGAYAYADETIIHNGKCGATLTWHIDVNGLLTIDGIGAMDNYSFTGPLAPWYSYDDTITAVKIESGVTSIDDDAFSGLSEIEIVYWNATSCTIKGDLYFPNELFGDSVSVNGLNVIFGNGVETIPSNSFSDCTNLKSVTISSTVTNIAHSTFSGCTGLTTITIPEGVKTIGNAAFRGCSSLTSVIIPDSVTSMGKTVFMDCENLTKVTLGSGITNIDDDAFRNCKSLTEITLPENVEDIGNHAFQNCQSLTEITIPESVEDIGSYAFWNCKSLTDIYYTGTRNDWLKISISRVGNDTWSLERKLHYVKSTKTSVSEDGKTFIVKPVNVKDGEIVILVLTDGNRVVEIQTATYKRQDISFVTAKAYTTAKVMVWDSLLTMKPVCDIEHVK